MTVITGETGAGKTLLVDALELLCGGRADPQLGARGRRRSAGRRPVRSDGDDEVVLARVDPGGRAHRGLRQRPARDREPSSRSAGAALVDLHGQHAHQSLLAPVEQRALLDRFAGEQRGGRARDAARRPRREARRIDDELAGLGGDERARAREVDLLRYQLDEIDAAEIADARRGRSAPGAKPSSSPTPRRTARRSRPRTNARRRGARTRSAPRSPRSRAARRSRRRATGCTRCRRRSRKPRTTCARPQSRSSPIRERLADVQAAPGPARGADAQVRARRSPMSSTTRAETRARLERARATRRPGRGARGSPARGRRHEAARRAAAHVEAAREAAARRSRTRSPSTSASSRMPAATFSVDSSRGRSACIGDDGADDVTFLLAPNPGEPPRPLAKAASGGELSRAMLALRVVLSEAPPTLVFDEVDAGIGGEAGAAVGRALASLGGHHQVLCVTHLAAGRGVRRRARRRVEGRGSGAARSRGADAAARRRAGQRDLARCSPASGVGPRAPPRARAAWNARGADAGRGARADEAAPAARRHRAPHGRARDRTRRPPHQGSRQAARAGRDRDHRPPRHRPRRGREPHRGGRRSRS